MINSIDVIPEFAGYKYQGYMMGHAKYYSAVILSGAKNLMIIFKRG